MNEELEFLISQYLDGSLSVAERSALEAQLSHDAAARTMLDEYRSLESALKTSMPVPDVKWDLLAVHLSNAVADHADAMATVATSADERPTMRLVADCNKDEGPHRQVARPFRWMRMVSRFAVAACLLLGVGIAARVAFHHETKPNDQMAKTDPIQVDIGPKIEVAVANQGSIEVTGPTLEVEPQAGQVEVSVAGPNADSPNWALAEGVIHQPARLVISLAKPVAANDDAGSVWQ